MSTRPRFIEMARQAALLSMIPLALGLGPAIGFFLGDWLDRRWGTGPWLLRVGVIIGIAAGVRQAVFLFQAAMRPGAHDGAGR